MRNEAMSFMSFNIWKEWQKKIGSHNFLILFEMYLYNVMHLRKKNNWDIPSVFALSLLNDDLLSRGEKKNHSEDFLIVFYRQTVASTSVAEMDIT